MQIKLYLREGWAFVDIGDGYMLCIGKEEDIKDVTPAKIGQMYREALATSQYHGLEPHREKRH